MTEKQKALLVGVNLYDQDHFQYSMMELKNLAAACDIEVAGEVTQNLSKIHKAHYIGSGKLQETIELRKETNANMVIFNDELSPTQTRNLEEAFNCGVIDRTMLILAIFERRAKTREAMLQVEVAHLKYMLPRIVGQGEALGRQGGGVGLRNRGSGETKLELDRRKIEEKISFLNKELESLVSQREVQRNLRNKSGIPLVSLVGYTNAGKSTIMNALVKKNNASLDKQVLEKDMLFATLDTSVRKMNLPKNQSFLLADTVGFVDKLPHHLVKAFRSTLEEAASADLLIHVVDYSSPYYQEQINVTNKTLEEMGIDHIPMIYAFNKADLTDCKFPLKKGNRLYLSAKQGAGIEELIDMISEITTKDHIQCEMLIPFDEGGLVSYLNQYASILSISYEIEGTKLSLKCRKSDFEKYREYVI
ncbi:GTPase HflX [Bacillus litorisediminis]|uniref:GTPase HflX n=1 Tax=Bacillus litorisediminis TaxID=2922713 RepID=UPI001FABE1BE|nr:GTPase HflX [Bacillus litorisediminis]